MNNTDVSEKRIIAGNTSFILALVILSLGCWNEYAWYEFFAPLGTLISFVFLGICVLCYVPFKELIRDKMFIAMAVADVLAIIHLFVIKSNKGAFLTVCDLLFVIYLFDKIRIPKKILYILTGYIAFYFFYWTIDVKGYFKGYNTNYGGLVLITGFVFAIAGFFYIRDELVKRGKIIWARLLYIPILFMFAWGYNIISWYRARCALLGYLVFVFLILMPAKVWKNKAFYTILMWGTTLGSILISLAYVWLGTFADKFTIQIFYKNIISGREEIWSELWFSYLTRPITGIGSSYVMKVDWMGGMFEVHNGLLDILFVHGTSVFVIVLVMLLLRLKGMNGYAARSIPQRCALAGIFAMLTSSILENFFIVPPFLLCFLLLATLSHGAD